MMMGGMGAGFGLMLLVYALLMLALVLGFAYIVWTLALKESGYLKTTGQVFACAIAALATIVFLAGLVNSGRMSDMSSKKLGGKEMKQMQEMQKMMKEMRREMR
jgi:membrane protein implicated in regulation of membrane protease activity